LALVEHFSLLNRTKDRFRPSLMDYNFILDELKNKFGVHEPKVAYRHINDPLRPLHMKGQRNWFVEFEVNNMLYLFNYNIGNIWVYHGPKKQQVAIYNLLYDPFGRHLSKMLPEVEIPKGMQGPIITEDRSDIRFNYRNKQFFKAFNFPVINKARIPCTPPSKHGLDFAVLDFECYHEYLNTGEFKKADLHLFAAGVHWQQTEYNPEYKRLKDDFIKSHMRGVFFNKQKRKEEVLLL
jgi:hypothetical protein